MRALGPVKPVRQERQRMVAEEWQEPDVDDLEDESSSWIVIGYVPDKITADFVMDSLKSYDIPAALNSKSGFFGAIGMTSVESPFPAPVGRMKSLRLKIMSKKQLTLPR